jgi:hypothetical protein
MSKVISAHSGSWARRTSSSIDEKPKVAFVISPAAVDIDIGSAWNALKASP